MFVKRTLDVNKLMTYLFLFFFFSLLFRRQIEPYGEAGKPKPFCTKKKLLIIAIVLVMLLLYALGLGIGLAVGLSRDRVTEDKPIEVKIPIGAVVTDHEACSEIGRYRFYYFFCCCYFDHHLHWRI